MGKYKKDSKIREGWEDTRRVVRYQNRRIEVLDISMLTNLTHIFIKG